MDEIQILIVCGEASGDLNAANLCREILKINPRIKVSAVGGALLRQTGAKIIYDIKSLSVMGFFDVLKKLPRFFALKNFLLREISQQKPKLVILVDFSGFNLRFAKAINNTTPIVYYTSPQVWASRPGRIETIKKYVRKMIVFFKFEEEFYRKHGVDTSYVGHPLLEIAKASSDKKTFLTQYNLSVNKTTAALLPGSRKSEITNILPVMLESCKLIRRNFPDIQFVIAKSAQVDSDVYQRVIDKAGQDVLIVEGKTYDCLNAADFALVCSGSATLETAILGIPFAIIYKMNFLNYFLYRPQVKLPYIGMVNIVAGEKIIPEFIQFQAKAEKIAEAALEILQNPSRKASLQQRLLQIKTLLGEPGASARAAGIILSLT